MTRFARVTVAICLLASGAASHATDYHVHPVDGDDARNGTSAEQAWKSLARIAATDLQPGDRVLLASGQEFLEPLVLKNVRGKRDKPVVVAAYAASDESTKPVIRIRDAVSAVHIINSSHVTVRGLDLTSQELSPGIRQEPGMRVGLLVEMTRRGDFENIRLEHLDIHDVYFEPPGVTRSAAETRSANGTQSYGYGIRVLNKSKKATLTGLAITGTSITRVSHTGIKIGGNENKGVRKILIENNRISNTGGPGMQMGRVQDMVVRGNIVNGSGSVEDSRNWGRGSGMWTWNSDDVLIEKNAFLNANGPADSAGVHIDFGCRNVIIQHNLSANNAGGFCEILGNGHNNAYRYNVSINDGFRVKGENGAFQEGKTFWLSGFVGGNKDRVGPFNSYFYNNTIFVDKSIVSKIAVSSTADGVLIANNIFYIEGESAAVLGDQYVPDREGRSKAKNVVFRNNLFLHPDSWPVETGLSDESPVYGDPEFNLTVPMTISSFRPANIDLVKDAGIPITALPGDVIGLKRGLDVSVDILGNPVTGRPDLGSIEVSGDFADE